MYDKQIRASVNEAVAGLAPSSTVASAQGDILGRFKSVHQIRGRVLQTPPAGTVSFVGLGPRGEVVGEPKVFHFASVFGYPGRSRRPRSTGIYRGEYLAMDKRDEESSILLAELDHVRKTIADLLKSGDQVLAVTAAAVGGIVLAFGNSHEKGLALILPLLLLIPLAYVTRLNGLIQHLGGYRKALEGQINALHGKVLLSWEADVAPLQKKSVNAYVLYGLVVCLWCALVGYGDSVAENARLSLSEAAGLQVSYALGGLFVLVAWVTGLKMFGKAYWTSHSALRAHVFPEDSSLDTSNAGAQPVIGIVVFSFGNRGPDLEPGPCNKRLGQAVAEIASNANLSFFIVAQWEVARALESLGIDCQIVGSDPESYLDTETVWAHAQKSFLDVGVRSIIPVAQPFVHLFAVRRLIARDHRFSVQALPIPVIGWDRSSLNRQWWTRGPVRFLFYSALRLAHVPGVAKIRRHSLELMICR